MKAPEAVTGESPVFRPLRMAWQPGVTRILVWPMARILVVEDDKYFRAMVCSTLIDGGHSVAEAPDGRDVLKVYRQRLYDVVIMDLLMPEKDGIETLTVLKREFPSSRVIAMSGGGQYAGKEDYLRVARAIGAADSLTKPFSPKTLLAAVSRLVPPVAVAKAAIG
jgi:CheY-like chemotaxis protein